MRVKDARQTFLGIWIRQLIEGQPIEVFGDGRQMRDFNYVDDVVEAMLRCAASSHDDGQVFNLGADPPVSLKDLAALLVELHGSGEYRFVPFPPDRKAIDIGDYYADYRLIQSRLGWTPKVSLRQGLEKTLAFYRKNHQHYWDKA
jgi:UDP-glucose 4-epimerase